MRIMKYHPTLAPIGEAFDKGEAPQGEGWVDKPEDFPKTKVYLYHPWKAPQGQTFEIGKEPAERGWVASRSLFPPSPDPIGPIRYEKRIPALVRVAEVLRTRGYDRPSLARHIRDLNKKVCQPVVPDHLEDEVVRGTANVEGFHCKHVLRAYGDALHERGCEIEAIYFKLSDFNRERNRPVLDEEEIVKICNFYV